MAFVRQVILYAILHISSLLPHVVYLRPFQIQVALHQHLVLPGPEAHPKNHFAGLFQE